MRHFVSFAEQQKRDIRTKLIQNYGRVCFYCDRKLTDPELTLDHFIPMSSGGNNKYENMVIACQSCNLDKKSLMPEEYLAVLKVRRNMLFRKVKVVTGTIKSLEEFIESR